jgi:hypothetical protein
VGYHLQQDKLQKTSVKHRKDGQNGLPFPWMIHFAASLKTGRNFATANNRMWFAEQNTSRKIINGM